MTLPVTWACLYGMRAPRSGSLTPPCARRGASPVSTPSTPRVRPDSSPVHNEHEWSLAVVSAGVDAAVNARANTLAWPSGQGRYLRAVLGELTAPAPYGYRLTTDTGIWQGRALLVAAATLATSAA